jgi:hypothetical protein
MSTAKLISREERSELFSRPFYEIDKAFKTQQAQYIVTHCYDAMDRNLYFYAGYFLQRGMNDEELSSLQQSVQDRIRNIAKECKDETARIQELIRGSGVVKVPKVGYSLPKQGLLKISNPLTREFIEGVQALEDVCIAIDTAWLLGAIQGYQRNDALYLYRNKFRSLNAALRTERSRIDRMLSQRVMEREREKEAERSDRRKRKANSRAVEAKEAPKTVVEAVARSAEVKPSNAKESKEAAADKATKGVEGASPDKVAQPPQEKGSDTQKAAPEAANA